MPYRSPVSDFRFIMDHIVEFDAVAQTDKYEEATPDLVDAILGEAGKLCDEVIYPVQRNGDLHPAKLENGIVRTSPGFAEAFSATGLSLCITDNRMSRTKGRIRFWR